MWLGGFADGTFANKMLENAKSLVLERDGEKDGFAERFGITIPNGSLIFLEGKEGTGKSIFCQRFCYSFLKNGSTCSYVSTQYTIKSFLRQTASVGYDVRKYLMSGKLFSYQPRSCLLKQNLRILFLKV
jgi:flagellar protein FlaH